MTAAAIYQWAFHPQEVPLEVKKDALARISVHAVLLTILVLYFKGFGPFLGEMFSGFGAKLPWAIQTMIDHSEFVSQWLYLLVPLLVVGLVADYRFYIFLYMKWGKQSARKWAYGVTFLLSAATVFYVLPANISLMKWL